MVNNSIEWELKYIWNTDIYNIFKNRIRLIFVLIDIIINTFQLKLMELKTTKDVKI